MPDPDFLQFFKREIRRSDWELLEPWARRMRRLRLLKSPEVVMKTSAFRSIGEALRAGVIPTPMFPNVTDITYEEGGTCEHLFFTRIVSQAVTAVTLDLSVGMPEGGQRLLLSSLFRACKGLESITFYGGILWSGPGAELYRIVSGLPRLSSVDLGLTGCSGNILRGIGLGRSLKTLRVTVFGDGVQQDQHQMVKLTRCHLRAAVLASILAFTERMTVSPLEVYVGTFRRSPSVVVLLGGLRLLAGFRDTLREIELTWDDDGLGFGDFSHHGNYVDGDAIRLLFPCSRLEVLRVNLLASFGRVDDGLMGEIPAAWPSLRVLDLGGTSEVSWPSSVSVSGVASLADGCKRLTELGLCFSTPREFDLSSIAHVENRNVSALHVGCGKVLNKRLAVEILSSLFPTLWDVSWSSKQGDLLEGEEEVGEDGLPLSSTRTQDELHRLHGGWDTVSRRLFRMKFGEDRD